MRKHKKPLLALVIALGGLGLMITIPGGCDDPPDCSNMPHFADTPCGVAATCPSGQKDCDVGGGCDNIISDPAHCGVACTPCGSTAPFCKDGVCDDECGPPFTDCREGVCANLADDEFNCGACGNACTAGQLCVSQVCVNTGTGGAGGNAPTTTGDSTTTSSDTTTSAGGAGGCDTEKFTDCGPGQCVDTSSDPEHCGECNFACPSGVCVAGGCTGNGSGGSGGQGGNAPACDGVGESQPPCEPRKTLCGGCCVDIQSHPQHCGDCDKQCVDPQPYCGAGICVANCKFPLETCEGFQCFNTMVDPNHCGGCDNECDAGFTCVNKHCTEPL